MSWNCLRNWPECTRCSMYLSYASAWSYQMSKYLQKHSIYRTLWSIGSTLSGYLTEPRRRLEAWSYPCARSSGATTLNEKPLGRRSQNVGCFTPTYSKGMSHLKSRDEISVRGKDYNNPEISRKQKKIKSSQLQFFFLKIANGWWMSCRKTTLVA